ncbi:hypothetical protein [Ruegeria atlantica]|uniref:hypothetical protein n=1 Tax=Ruegeria atlantica TaxID=81569 RepID=UPI00147C2CE1|nr:hypothetical protein [Ruegeria atlantica]
MTTETMAAAMVAATAAATVAAMAAAIVQDMQTAPTQEAKQTTKTAPTTLAAEKEKAAETNEAALSALRGKIILRKPIRPPRNWHPLWLDELNSQKGDQFVALLFGQQSGTRKLPADMAAY